MGFDNLKTAINPLSEEDEKSLLILLLEELNNLYLVNLGMDMENVVFDDDTTERTDLKLIGAIHLSHIAKHVDHDTWNVTDLTRPGWRINQNQWLL